MAVAANWRSASLASDPQAVADILSGTGLFSAAEVQLGIGLLREPASSGYQFVFCDVDGQLAGYSCFGRIPATVASFDLYWIAVAANLQGLGLGKQLLARTEAAIQAQGGGRLYVDTSGRADYLPTRQFYAAAGYGLAAELADFYRPGDSKAIFCKVFMPDEIAAVS